MLGINGWEIPLLLVIALVILGPERLPKFAADAGRFLRGLRRMAAEARDEVTLGLGPEFRDISLQDLDPRTFVTGHLLDGDDDLDLSGDGPDGPSRSPAASRPRDRADGADLARGPGNNPSVPSASTSSWPTAGHVRGLGSDPDPDRTEAGGRGGLFAGEVAGPPPYDADAT